MRAASVCMASKKDMDKLQPDFTGVSTAFTSHVRLPTRRDLGENTGVYNLTRNRRGCMTCVDFYPVR